MEWTPFPMLKYSDDPNNPETALAALVPPALAVPVETNGNSKAQAETSKPPVVDVTMQITEGPQYFVNRITFTGNTTTRDNVIRREMRLIEGNVFDTEALKYSVRRLNQLGYFKEMNGNDSDMKVDKTPGKDKQRRRHAEVRGAEPEPADVRRRRVAVPKGSSASSPSRPRTSWAAARA